MNDKERQKRLEFAKRQFQIHQTYAMYWQAMALTGVATMRDTAQGRPVTEEERARGESIGWTPHTDQEKIKHALDTMKTHIHLMNECNETISGLMEE